MLSKACELTLRRALAVAGAAQAEKATEHLLLALTDDPDATAALENSGADLNRLRAALGSGREAEHPRTSAKEVAVEVMHLVQRASRHAQAAGEKEITSAGLVLALFAEQEGRAVAVLQEQGISGSMFARRRGQT